MELTDFTLQELHKIPPSDLIHFPLTLWLNVAPYRHTLEVETASKKITHQKYTVRSFFFSCRSLIIFLEKLSSVSTNCSRYSFQVCVHPHYPFLLVLFIRVHLFIYIYYFYNDINLFIVQVYIYIYLSLSLVFFNICHIFLCIYIMR